MPLSLLHTTECGAHKAFKRLMRVQSEAHLCVNQRGERQVIKQVCEVFPNICISVLSQALVIETIHLCDLSALVVPPKDGNSLRVANLKKQCNNNKELLK